MQIAEPTPAVCTWSQWIAAIFRSIATRLDGYTITPPSARDIATERLVDAKIALREAEIGLLDAEAETERWKHTVKMLTERVSRLSKF